MNLLWSVGIFSESPDFDLKKDRPSNLIKTFNAKKIRTKRKHIHTYADPFLFVEDSKLYVFIEIQQIGGRGYIHAWRTADLRHWLDLGPVLKDHVHLSYPHIFREDRTKGIYLLPESRLNKRVDLYRFQNFPYGLQSYNTLLEGDFVDSSLIRWQDTWYLITTNKKKETLELYFSDSLESKNWLSHPGNPVSDDPMFNRNGGGFLLMNNQLFRIAQNTRTKYGDGIVVMQVEMMTKESYQEKVVVQDLLPAQNFPWQEIGRHHLSMTSFGQKTIIAMDGLHSDYLLNRFSNLAFKLLQA